MKQTFWIFFLSFFIIGCTDNDNDQDISPEQILQDVLESISFPQEISDNLDLPNSYTLNDHNVNAMWVSKDPEVINNNGEITQAIDDQVAELKLTLSYKDQSVSKDFLLIVKGFGVEVFVEEALLSILPTSTKIDIELPESFRYQQQRITAVWESTNLDVLTNDGQVGLITEDTTIILKVTAHYFSKTLVKEFPITILALSLSEQAEYVLDNLNLSSAVTDDISLPTTFAFGLTGTWESSLPDILSDDGIVGDVSGTVTVTLTLTLNTGDRRTFEVNVLNHNHMVYDRTFLGTMNNVEKNEDKKLVLQEGKTQGTYITPVIDTLPFKEAVASWAATSSTTATNELFIRVLVDGVWSQYFSYGQFGLGLQNRSVDASDNIARLSYDEIIIRDTKTANALQMKIVLKRTTTEVESPIVSLLAVALNIYDYTYNVDISNIRNSVDYDVPKLYQREVPGIGNSICSPTSATMLLLYKGQEFPDWDQSKHHYLHEYVARSFHDGRIFGNWVYNTVGMSAYGEVSYVQRMYSYQELIHHLDQVGPVSVSVRGTLVGESGYTWTTNGHLIVVRGYKYENNQLYILANDPAIQRIDEMYTIENFMNFWRGVSYIIE